MDPYFVRIARLPDLLTCKSFIGKASILILSEWSPF